MDFTPFWSDKWQDMAHFFINILNEAKVDGKPIISWQRQTLNHVITFLEIGFKERIIDTSDKIADLFNDYFVEFER